MDFLYLFYLVGGPLAFVLLCVLVLELACTGFFTQRSDDHEH
jgi:hypothetical protein